MISSYYIMIILSYLFRVILDMQAALKLLISMMCNSVLKLLNCANNTQGKLKIYI